MTSFMADHGARLVDNGYPILPILPGTKKPGRFLRGSWGDYPAWTRHCERPTTLTEVEVWASWPGAGIGLACGTLVGIDIDVLDADLVHQVDRLTRDRLGDTPLLRIGRAPKRLLVYRAELPFAGHRRSPLEVLGHGRQFVAFALHPDTGKPYAWPEESPLTVAFEDVPAITEEAADAWLAAALELVPAELRATSLGQDASPRSAFAPTSLLGTYAAVREALAFVPNADLDYDSWVRIGMALKGALGDDGGALFAAWSAQSAKNVPETTAKAWASFKPTAIGAGTLYHHALEHGWRPDPALVLDGALVLNGPHPAAALIERVEAAAAEPAPAAPPPAPPITIPGGILGDLVHYMLATARRPQPELAIGASLCALGALMGRKYRTTTNLRSNLYVVGIADSGSGKNHSREIINELFVAAGLGHYLGGNRIASSTGLLTALHRQPALLLQLDEFGMFLQTAADRRRSPRHVTEILDNMTELYTAAGGIFLGAEYANLDGRTPRRDINQPCLCVYGTTAPLHFWNALQSANVIDGSLARMIIIHCRDDYPEEQPAAGIRKSPPGLLVALKLIADGGGYQPPGNLSGLTSDPTTAVAPMTVEMNAEAADLLRGLSRTITGRLREARGTPFTPILARIAENAAKVALTRAVANDPVAPLIRAADLNWGISLVQGCADRTVAEVERRVSDNETERNHKRVLEIIRGAGPGGIPKSELIARSRFLDRRQRDEIIAELVESEWVSLRVQKTGKKPVTILFASRGAR